MLFLKKKKSGTRFTRHTILEEDLYIRFKDGTMLAGEFPRRVLAGEQILSHNHCHILSPINGIARLNEGGVSITQDGQLQLKKSREIREFSFTEITDKLIRNSVVSLDFDCQSLAEKFFVAKEESHAILLSPFANTGTIDFSELIRNELWTEFLQFKTNLMTIFRDSLFNDFIGPGNMVYHYPDDIPEYFISRYCDPTLNPTNTLYLGAETIYHLLRALYHGVPFYQRYISVLLVDKKGNVKTIPEAFYVFNGQNLSYIIEKVPEQYSYFTWNSIYNDNPVLERNKPFYIDIFTHNAFIFFEKKEIRRDICLDCNRCNFLCPTQANPHALIMEPEAFLVHQCIECSICTVHCPGGINMRKKIKDIKNGKQAQLHE